MFQRLNDLRITTLHKICIRIFFAVLTLTISSPAALAATKFDFGGPLSSGSTPLADYVYYQPSTTFGFWLGVTAGTVPGTTGMPVFDLLGTPNRIAPADYNGDGFTDFGVFNGGPWAIHYSGVSGSIITGVGTGVGAVMGAVGDIPQSANFVGNSQAEIALFNSGTWTFQTLPGHTPLPAPGSPPIPFFGTAGDKPVTEDYDGDGYSDQAIFRPGSGTWWIRNSSSGAIVVFAWGISTDTPVPADYDGDGKADIAVFRNGIWFILRSTSGSALITSWGTAGDLPIPADYDGDGKADTAIYRAGAWWINGSFAGPWLISGLGSSTDEPVPHAYIQ